jgi:hypothetical protein
MKSWGFYLWQLYFKLLFFETYDFVINTPLCPVLSSKKWPFPRPPARIWALTTYSENAKINIFVNNTVFNVIIYV